MKWIYIFIVIVIAGLASGCVDRKQAETPLEAPVQTPVSPGEVASTPVITATSAVPSDDIFSTESDLTAMNATLSDMEMQISLLDTI